MDQTQLDEDAVRAKKDLVDAAKHKDALAGGVEETQHAVHEAEEDVKRAQGDLKRQFLDNSKPTLGGDPELNTAPAPDAVPDLDGNPSNASKSSATKK